MSQFHALVKSRKTWPPFENILEKSRCKISGKSFSDDAMH
jgi:hypothetical protein